MSPERPSSRRAASSGSTPKPYVRTRSTSTNKKEDSSSAAQSDIAQVDGIASNPGFPSYAQYKNIEANYLNSILPKRQCRALISQAMFDRIWYILQNPNTSAEDAQFRYWVRKMFTLGTLNDLNLAADVLDEQTPQAVMLHDGRIVAIKEQIYDILCYAHGTTNHGGRDKTFQSVRKHYSWVPKELVAQFTKACPSCLMKKCGISRDIQADIIVDGDESVLPTLRDFIRNMGKGATRQNPKSDQEASSSGIPHVPGPSIPVDPNSVPDDPTFEQSPSRVLGESGSMTTMDNLLSRYLNKSEPCEMLMNPRVSSEPMRRAKTGLQSLPMSREVSLYQGLPNGWQYRTDYATAHAEFTRKQGDPHLSVSVMRERRPRIPSVAPMRNVHSESEADGHRGAVPTLRPCNWDERRASPPPEMPSAFASAARSYIPQIDPALLAPPHEDSGRDSGETTSHGYSSAKSSYDSSRSTNQPRVGTSIRRPDIPPPISLQSLSSQKAIEAFLAHRSTGDSPDSSATYSNASPTSSAGSYSSRLSSFPMTATSSVSPATSFLPTPVDETVQHKGDGLGKELANTAGGMHLNASVEAVCEGAA